MLEKKFERCPKEGKKRGPLNSLKIKELGTDGIRRKGSEGKNECRKTFGTNGNEGKLVPSDWGRRRGKFD